MLFLSFSIGMFFFFFNAIHMIFSNYRDGIAQKYVFFLFNIKDGILNHILFISALRDDAEEFLWDERQPW